MVQNKGTHRVGTYAQVTKRINTQGGDIKHNVAKRINTQDGDIGTICKNERTHTIFEPPEYYI